MATGHATPRWARLSSWLIAVAVWTWVINDLILQDLPKTSILANAGAELLLTGLFTFNSLFSVAAATVVAAFAMFLVRLIGRVAAWLKLRF